MKKLNSFVLLTFIFSLLIACNSDDSSGDSGSKATISVADLDSGVFIEGATKKSGTAPAPTGTLDLQIDELEQKAFQSTGYAIEFTSNDNISGAYVQLKSVDGNIANGYFDVPSSAFNTNNKKSLSKRKKGSLNNTKLSVVGDYEIDVNFNDTILPGEFCYEICVYDANGNISQIQEVCVTVQAWGGNDNIVDEWIFDRFEPAGTDDTYIINCQNNETIEAAYSQYSKDEWTFVLNSDGSYYEIYDQISKQLDVQASESDCSAIYSDVIIEDKEKFSGYWSYNDQKLTVIDFKYENLLDSSFDEDYEDGELYFEGVSVEVINDELILSETYDEDGVSVTYKAIFKRK